MKTDAEYFLESVQGLAKQDFIRSVKLLKPSERHGYIPTVGEPEGEKEYCRYRGEGSLRCAIGQLITDEQYRPEMESWDSSAPFFQDKGLLLGMSSRLFSRLQSAHDTSTSGADMKRNLAAVAKEFGFDVPEVLAGAYKELYS